MHKRVFVGLDPCGVRCWPFAGCCAVGPGIQEVLTLCQNRMRREYKQAQPLQ